MEWFHSTERGNQKQLQDSLASNHEIKSAFIEQRDYLNWVALLITGDHALADQAVINASDLSESSSSVFRDWLIGWTKSATVRAAVREVRDLIFASASRYTDSSCEHSDHDVLSDDQIESLRHVDTRDIVAALDPLARSALVLRGIQHFSIADCALLLDIRRQVVAAAYRQALRWNHERAGAHGAPNEDRRPLAFDHASTEKTSHDRWKERERAENE
jgi:DNA-directed RNA polymerase specialized sigma24 family protein